jgi:hypothetical protein
MKNIFKIISLTLFIGLLPAFMVSGQGRKTEQKIKIIVVDDSGKKTEIDTLISGSFVADTLILRDGKAIIVKKSSDEEGVRPDGDSMPMTVIVSSDDNESEGNKNVNYQKTIILKDKKSVNDESEKSYTYTIKADTKENDAREADNEKTKYVINKDGIIITVEGEDYEKVKEMVKKIEGSIGTGKKPAGKSR